MTDMSMRAADNRRDMDLQSRSGKPRSRWMRYAPLLAITLGAVLIWGFAGDYISFQALKDNRETLLQWRDTNFTLAALGFAAAYALFVALSIPGAIWLTLGGGFVFGAWIATPLIVTAATLGASVIFLVARGSLGAELKERAGPWLGKLEAGIRANAASYMLILRLAPAAPFFIANLAPAFLGVPFRTYVWTTFIGIIPATAIYAWIGAGLGEVIDQGGEPDLSVIFEPHVLGPLLGLAALSAAPILLKQFGAWPSDAESRAESEAESERP